MTTLSSPDSCVQDREEWIAQQNQRQSLASSTRALLDQVQAVASRGSKSQQAAWREHVEALVNLICFAECPDFRAHKDCRTVSVQQLRTFGALLRDRRSAAGLSRVALAQRAKLSDSTVKFVETARHPPSQATLIRLLAVPELNLAWEHIPGKLGAAPLAVTELGNKKGLSTMEPAGPNCYVTPTLEPVQMVVDLGRFLNGAGGLIDPASVYLDHQSAAGYLAICRQYGPVLEHRRRLPLRGIARRIMGATDRAALDVVALGSGAAQSEVCLVQHLLEDQPRPDLQLWLVDISQPLLSVGLKHAIETIGSRACVNVTAIQGNFHHLQTFESLRDVSAARSDRSAQRCCVYSMLGGTLDLLDHELRFVEHTIVARPGDWLVLDVQPAYGPSGDPELIQRRDPFLKSPIPRAYAEWLSGPIHRHCKDVRSIEFSLRLDTHTSIPGSYAVDAIANVQTGDRAATRQFVIFRWKRYDVAQLEESMARIGWVPIATLPCGPPASELAVAMLFRKSSAKGFAEAMEAKISLPASPNSQRFACATAMPSPVRDTPARTMENGQPGFPLRQLEPPPLRVKDRPSPRTTPSALLLGILLLLRLLVPSPAFGQTASSTAAAPRSINPTLSFTGGSCGTLFGPCPAISRLGLFVWLSGQYLGTGIGGNPYASTLGGAVDVAMEVANRVAVSASIPGALTRIQGQYGDEVWGIGGPLEARARVRLGPASAGFYSVQARPRWSSVIEVRTQFLIPGFDGDPKYVGRVQRGFVQPSLYGAGELNMWRFQFAPGAGILVGDREAHVDLSLRASVQLLDRLFGDVEVLRRQALGVPDEPGRCQSAWMVAAGVRFQLRRGMFLSASYVGGQGDCVPQHSFMLSLGLAFGEEHMRIPTPSEVGFIRKWHAILMGMVDPVLDCQGIMRADDGTPMFRFGYPDPRNPSIIWRNHVAYRVGEHFWEKGGNLYRDTDLTHPVLDLYGEAPLTFAERAAMHDCPTLPGLGSPCQVALNLPALRQKIERGDGAVQVALTEDAQILACLNHLSPMKAAAVFTSIQAALGPLLDKLPQVARWPNPAAPPASPREGQAAAAVAPPHTATAPPEQPMKVAAPPHPAAHRGQQHPPTRKPGYSRKPGESDEAASNLPHLPSLSGGRRGEPSPVVTDDTAPPSSPAEGAGEARPAVSAPSGTTHPRGQTPPPPTLAQSEPPKVTPQGSQAQSRPRSPQATSGAVEPAEAAPGPAGEHGSQTPELAAPLCGTYCKLTLGAAAAGIAVVGGEVAKDGIILGTAAAGAGSGISAAGVAGSAVAGTIVADGVAEHVKSPSAPTESTRPASPEQPARPADNTAGGEGTEQLPPNRGNGGRGGGAEHARVQARVVKEVRGSDEVAIDLKNGEKRIVDVEAEDGSWHQIGDMRSRGGQLRPSARERAAIEDLRKAKPDKDIYFHDKRGQHPPLKNPDQQPDWKPAPRRLRKDPD